ncbi:MAG: tartrate dehydrogenase [bacterium]|jgi:tartrate dehydrogenase/decarboxylase/D-malate dehydrogenase
MVTYRIAVIPGDGIGPEVLAEGVKTLECVAALDQDLNLEWEFFPWGSAYYQKTGRMMSLDALEILKGFDAIYLGAVGSPEVPDHTSVRLVLEIRSAFEQYVNLRPIKLLQGVQSPLRDKGPTDIDLVIVRENTEGEYTPVGGIVFPDTLFETATQVNVFTRKGIERIMGYGFELAQKRRGRLTSVTKSNALQYSMVLWDKIFYEQAREHPAVSSCSILVDAMAMYLVREPENFDVVVTSNLFGDILSDLGAALQGGLGFAPGANLDPTGKYPSMFEPIHGSSPKMAGKGIANPIATIWAGSMLLEHLGEVRWSKEILAAIEDVLVEGRVRTQDIGGNSTTREMGDAIRQRLRKRVEERGVDDG